MIKSNKDKTDKDKDKFYFQGENFVVNGILQQDEITPPTFSDISDALRNNSEKLVSLSLFESTSPNVQEGNTFKAYFVRTRFIEVVRLAYSKVFIENPDASSIMMAYKLNSGQGSCDDSEFNTGYRLLRLLQAKQLKNAAIFVVRHSTGQHLGPARFDHIVTTASTLITRVAKDSQPEDPLGSPVSSTPSSPAVGGMNKLGRGKRQRKAKN